MRCHLHYSEPHLKAAFPKAGVISARQDKTRQDRNHFVWDTILAAGESTQVVYQAPHQGPNEIHGSHTKQASQKSLFNREVHNSKKLRIIIWTEHFRTLPPSEFQNDLPGMSSLAPLVEALGSKM
jgi:hypothetical protein